VEAVQTNSGLKSQKQKQNLPNQGGGAGTVWAIPKRRAEGSDLAVAASGSRKGSAGSKNSSEGREVALESFCYTQMSLLIQTCASGRNLCLRKTDESLLLDKLAVRPGSH
jgi:hypothetical protein